jgi:ADP-heptose:LPS heptosyltransferase
LFPSLSIDPLLGFFSTPIPPPSSLLHFLSLIPSNRGLSTHRPTSRFLLHIRPKAHGFGTPERWLLSSPPLYQLKKSENPQHFPKKTEIQKKLKKNSKKLKNTLVHSKAARAASSAWSLYIYKAFVKHLK